MFDVLITDDFAFRCEVDPALQINMHCEVYNWNKTVAKRMFNLFDDALEQFAYEGFSIAYCLCNNKRFIDFLGGGKEGGVINLDGVDYQVTIWELGV